MKAYKIIILRWDTKIMFQIAAGKFTLFTSILSSSLEWSAVPSTPSVSLSSFLSACNGAPSVLALCMISYKFMIAAEDA